MVQSQCHDQKNQGSSSKLRRGSGCRCVPIYERHGTNRRPKSTMELQRKIKLELTSCSIMDPMWRSAVLIPWPSRLAGSLRNQIRSRVLVSRYCCWKWPPVPCVSTMPINLLRAGGICAREFTSFQLGSLLHGSSLDHCLPQVWSGPARSALLSPLGVWSLGATCRPPTFLVFQALVSLLKFYCGMKFPFKVKRPK